MDGPAIPTGRDPNGNQVPIMEVNKNLEYRCVRCDELLDPRIGPHRQYFAHKRGALDGEKNCVLTSQEGLEELTKRQRTPDIVKSERERSIRLYVGHGRGDQIRFFGIIPALEWGHIPDSMDPAKPLSQIEIRTKGIENPPVWENFHPRESEVVVQLDPSANEYELKITGPEDVASISGLWTANGLTSGDVFVGDQRRAGRNRNGSVSKGDWVYALSAQTPAKLPDSVSKHDLGGFELLAFGAREETEGLLETFGENLDSANHGFDADIVLPGDAHPTVEGPVTGPPGDVVLVGVTPHESNPEFEVIPIGEDRGENAELEPTGPGNPRFLKMRIPEDRTHRISVHKRDTDMHRSVHLHPDLSDASQTEREESSLGIRLEFDDESVIITPFGPRRKFAFDEEFDPQTFPEVFEYAGPVGLELRMTGSFIDPSPLGPKITKISSAIDHLARELEDWISNGCELIQIEFDGHGSIEMAFPQPAVSETIGSMMDGSRSGGES